MDISYRVVCFNIPLVIGEYKNSLSNAKLAGDRVAGIVGAEPPKSQADLSALNSLLTYISTDEKGKGKYITCYAMRKKAGLLNSSNSVEGENEVIVGERQKVDERMFWTVQGSGPLASLTCIFANGEDIDWFIKGHFSFKKNWAA